MPTVKPVTRTRTYEVPVSILRRWKLPPEDATVLKLSLMNWSSKHTELERRRKSLLNRMRGDYFLVLYAPGGDVEHPTVLDAENEPAETQAPGQSSEK